MEQARAERRHLRSRRAQLRRNALFDGLQRDEQLFSAQAAGFRILGGGLKRSPEQLAVDHPRVFGKRTHRRVEPALDLRR